jgi:hypothetical protein
MTHRLRDVPDPDESGRVGDAEVIRELARVKVTFQLRAIATIIHGLTPHPNNGEDA